MSASASFRAAVAALLLASCTRASADSPSRDGAAPATVTTSATARPVPSSAPTTVTGTVAPTSTSTSTTSTTSTSSTSSTSSTTSTTSSTTTTTTTLPIPVFDAGCVVLVQPGDSLQLIADRFDDETVTGAAIQAENQLADEMLTPGEVLDVCVDNGIDDISGEAIGRNSVLLSLDVQEQQVKLNELFAGLGIRELLVDGVAGPVTRQRLCAARLAFNLPASTEDMLPGSAEEQTLMAATTLPIPFTSSILSERWILIDRTCQIMFVGEGTERLVFVFPTSTGQPGFVTRDQDRSRAFKFDPADGNGGWHDSLTYPAAEDNPLNGNMYRPLYFDRGQAIHGANNVPTSPASHGCARLRVEHQDLLLAWLGLADSGPTSSRDRINVTVNVQGAWVPR